MDSIKSNGITENTEKNILLGAGTIYKDLKFNPTTKKWEGTILGATSGGNKFTITNSFTSIEIDGALVKVKGFEIKQGETGTMEVNIIEVTPDILKHALLGKDGSTNVEGYKSIETKENIEDSDYLGNIAFVGFKTDGSEVIIIMENALCTSGLESDNKNKEGSVLKLVFECYANQTSSLKKLPIAIYYPDTEANQTENKAEAEDETEMEEEE